MNNGNSLAEHVAEEWKAAFIDAGFDEGAVAIWALDQAPPEGKSSAVAQWFMPHLSLDPPHGLSEKELEEAESKESAYKHRVIVYLRYPSFHELSPSAARAFLGAAFRHELEHAKQHERWGNELFFMDSGLIDPALWARAGQLPGGAEIYNLKPMELDANAASARYLREHHPDTVTEILQSEHGGFARCLTAPQNLDTLLVRTVSFLYLFRDEAVALADPLAVSAHLRLYEEAAAELWDELERSSGLG
jgi:hypothetical protein